jgi:outer membrane protein OmpA-like peptidoglycan-associated protein
MTRPEKIGALLGATLIWWGGSAYWHTCVNKKLCEETKTTPAVVSMSSKPSVIPSPVQPSPVAAIPFGGKIYFLPDSTSFRDEADANAIIASAAADWAKNKEASVTLTGYFANITSDVPDTIAQERAAVVKQALVGKGVASDKISAVAGINNPNDAPEEARRVVVSIK